MTLLRHVRLLAACLLLGLPAAGLAQTTDGYHAIQVLPVVVDTASFTQRITLRNPDSLSLQVAATYYPADGTAQATPISCPAVGLPAGSSVTVPSLRTLCPTLGAGSQFGTLVLRSGTSSPFAVYSRVSNAAGAGFSVEGFPAQTFTSATTVVTGLRRLAAGAGTPAFQTNCFVGNLGEFTPGPSPVTTDITVKLYQGTTVIGQVPVSLPPGRLVRLLDVFAAAGTPSGDLDDITAQFSATGTTRPGLLAFCTVQDNTSFGADFRIGKVERGRFGMLASQDWGATRNVIFESDLRFSGESAVRKFIIPAGSSRNVHVFYLRHPDVVDCKLWNPSTQQVADEAYGLEMRLLAPVSGVWQPVAGGSGITGFEGLYLGDKAQRGGGFNTIYQLEVESNGANEGVDRPYWLGCSSGSGATSGEMVLLGAPVVF
jgi:hypothetical protein